MRAALLALALSAPVAAQTVNTILSNGPTSNRYDLVILGDGYQASEQAQFDADALAMTNHLFSVEPYQTFGQFFNVYTVFRPSTMSGANHPDQNRFNNPVYGASYNTGGVGRCVYITNRSLALADAALAPSSEGRVVVIVNDSRYGGCAGTFAVSYNGSQMPSVQAHEIGHSLAGLADEYGGNGTYTGPEPGEVNVTANPAGQKWSQWLGSNGVGVFQGARYYDNGLYRPWDNCLMRSLGRPLCSVCREQITRVTHRIVSTIDAPTPASSNLTFGPADPPQTFSFTNLAPASSTTTITWTLDGQPVASGVTSYAFDPSTASLGTHTLQVAVANQSPFVRNDPTGDLNHDHRWTVQVIDPSAPDLTVDSVAVSSLNVQAGGSVQLTTQVRNTTPNAAASVRVEHFLSADTTIDSSDIYLGGYTIATVGPNQTVTRQRTVDLPSYLTQSIYVVGAVVDRENAIVEQDETNNLRTNVVFTAPAACGPTLEYRDPLLYPNDSATIDLASGGTVRPTIVAPCQNPGTVYFLVWGCTGTTPGTPLPGGLTVPLNQDFCTSFSLANYNGPIFVQSFAPLDARGHGYAEFRWPAGLGPLPISGHFAAVLIDGTRFSGATAPIAIAIQ